MPLKKRSAPLDPPFVFFVDRCLGRGVVPEALRTALLEGERVEIHDEHYLPNTQDIEWLSEVGKRGWIVISQDQNITRNPLEQRALHSASVAFFGLGSANATGKEKAESLVTALEGIRRALRRFSPPMIATVTQSGDVVVKWVNGGRLKQPRRISPKKKG